MDEMLTLLSTLTCPICSFQSKEPMPENACTWFYDCKNCGERLKPKPGDCCVFCSYGDVPCPPKQCDAECSSCGVTKAEAMA